MPGYVPLSMQDAKHRHGFIALIVIIDHNIRRDDANADARSQRGPQGSDCRMLGEKIIEPVETSIIFDRCTQASLDRKVIQDDRAISASAVAAMTTCAISPSKAPDAPYCGRDAHRG